MSKLVRACLCCRKVFRYNLDGRSLSSGGTQTYESWRKNNNLYKLQSRKWIPRYMKGNERRCIEYGFCFDGCFDEINKLEMIDAFRGEYIPLRLNKRVISPRFGFPKRIVYEMSADKNSRYYNITRPEGN